MRAVGEIASSSDPDSETTLRAMERVFMEPTERVFMEPTAWVNFRFQFGRNID